MAYKLIKIIDKILNVFIYLCLFIVFLFCLYALIDTIMIYFKASNNNISILKPDINDPEVSFKALKNINEDVVGWITIENTNIDYPIVVGENNSYYLNKDVYKNYSLSGSIFLDYRNSRDFSDLYSCLFGHHMNGGMMFGDVQKFSNESFFEQKKYGLLFTESGVYKLEIFAFLNTTAYDNYIYSVNQNDFNRQDKLLSYIKETAQNYRPIDIDNKDKIIALSTCSSANTNGRDILFVKVSDNNN